MDGGRPADRQVTIDLDNLSDTPSPTLCLNLRGPDPTGARLDLAMVAAWEGPMAREDLAVFPGSGATSYPLQGGATAVRSTGSTRPPLPSGVAAFGAATVSWEAMNWVVRSGRRRTCEARPDLPCGAVALLLFFFSNC